MMTSMPYENPVHRQQYCKHIVKEINIKRSINLLVNVSFRRAVTKRYSRGVKFPPFCCNKGGCFIGKEKDGATWSVP